MKSEQIKILELQLKILKAKGNKATAVKPSADELKSKAEKWFKDKLNLTITQRGLNIVLPTKKGNKTYEGVKLSNGKTAVYVYGGSMLKYVWGI